MKEQLKNLIHDACTSFIDADALPKDIHIERTRDTSHGDFASNIAMMLAKVARRKPREIAEQIVAILEKAAPPNIDKIEIAGPGFINFFMAPQAFESVIKEIILKATTYGHSTIGDGQKVQVEFVSANPTGPLHVGHGRGAAYGATVADLLIVAGFNVHREYYVNDAGRQMDILATSVWLRYLSHCGETIIFPSNGYQGDYVLGIADTIKQDHGEDLRRNTTDVMADLPTDAYTDENDQPQGDKEAHIDALIDRAKTLLGKDLYDVVFNAALNTIRDEICDDLKAFGVEYDDWFSERSLMTSGKVEAAIKTLKEKGHLYQSEGAWWFRSTDFGDEKDRVVIRENGQTTYFASDIAYHSDKLARGFDRVIDIWGADHHGYIPRVKAALTALGEDATRLDVLLVQFANLYRNGKKIAMSTRSGQFVTLSELRQEVGLDAARFFYVMRKCEQHMDFDLDLAKSQTNDNPVYYIQYAHARIHSVMRQLREKGWEWDQAMGESQLHCLRESHELGLMNKLSNYPDVIEAAAIGHTPHQLAFYLRELAGEFHTYYNAHQFLIEDESCRNARLTLINATRQVLLNGLTLLGMSAPERM